MVFAAALVTVAVPLGAIAADHVFFQPDAVKWIAGPPGLPPGGQFAVLSGDPGKAGALFVVRAKVPAGYTVPPHTHPTDETVTVLSGSFSFAMGDKLDKTKGTQLKVGGLFNAPAGMTHYAWFTEESIIQVHGVGPFDITYANPADDPRKK
jgi:quercetin dioxygenase-like cupin family protein